MTKLQLSRPIPFVVALRLSLPTLVALLPALTLRAGDGLVIRHEPVQCFVAGAHTRLNACIDPVAGVVQARLYFRTPGAGAWRYVPMERNGACFSALMPKPQP